MASIIGVAGGTGAGKTAIVQALAKRFGGVSLDLDSYYLDRSGISAEERGDLNYDEPSAFDVTLLLDHLRRLAAGEMVWKPRYSFDSYSRTGAEKLFPASLILVEGLFALWWEELRACMDLKVFVDAPADLRLLRRIRRDVSERGRNVESVLDQYVYTVRPMHKRYVEPTRLHADLVVGNSEPIEDCVKSVIAAVQAKGGKWDHFSQFSSHLVPS